MLLLFVKLTENIKYDIISGKDGGAFIKAGAFIVIFQENGVLGQ